MKDYEPRAQEIIASRGAAPPRERLHRLFDLQWQYTMEEYPAAHGFAVPDNSTYDPAAHERHWAALTTLFGAHLKG